MKIVSYVKVEEFIKDFLKIHPNSIVEEGCKDLFHRIEGMGITEPELVQYFNDNYMSAMYRCRSYKTKSWDIAQYRAACLFAEMQKACCALYE